MKESAVFDKPYVKKTAWVGVEAFPPRVQEDISTFSRRDFPIFKNKEDALMWLAKD